MTYAQDFLNTSVGRHEKMMQDRADAAIELIRTGDYKAAICALVSAQSCRELADECKLMMEVFDVNEGWSK